MRKYRPANGTEGMIFMKEWCWNCRYEDEGDGLFCPIMSATFMYDVNDPKYPRHWQYDGDKPVCTAFKKKEVKDGGEECSR
jgi:hypothetical protein